MPGDRHLTDLRRLLARGTVITSEPTDDEEAAALPRRGRRSGETVGKLLDGLTAGITSRSRTPLLHADGHVDVLSRYAPRELDQPGP